MLSAQRALIASITPQMRGIALRLSDPVSVVFYFECEPPEAQRQLAHDVVHEMYADFWQDLPGIWADVQSSSLPSHQLNAFDGWIYLRQEDEPAAA